MQANAWAAAPLAIDPNRETRHGKRIVKLMLEGQEGTLGNYSVQLERCETAVSHPRHTHNFEQIRLPIEGEFRYANDKVLPTGCIGYFPAGAYYGPETREPGTLLLAYQLGGATGDGFVSKRQRLAAFDELSKTGKFDTERGVYTWFDDKGQRHNKDAYEAIWEQAMGREAVYPKPRYNDIIVMDPKNYAWVEDGNSPGIAYKWLGTFTERGTRIGFLRLEAGTTYQAAANGAGELLFLTKGSVTCQGSDHAMHSALGFEPSEGPVQIRATEPSELLCVIPPQV